MNVKKCFIWEKNALQICNNDFFTKKKPNNFVLMIFLLKNKQTIFTNWSQFTLLGSCVCKI